MSEIDDDLLDEARRELDEPTPHPKAFIYACELSDILPNGSRGKVVVAEFDEIAIFNFNGTLYAISNICPHQQSPLLAEGRVDKDALVVTCPMHGWMYHIPTGKMVGGSGSVATYAVRLEGESVWVEEPRPRLYAPLLNDDR
jgi:nitrite reductase/ring-hydroxylating ferredoxin subunit